MLLKNITILTVFSLATLSTLTYATSRYVVPPSQRSYGHVPVISDKQMEECVEKYNEMLELKSELENYNSYYYRDEYKSQEYNHLVDWYNMTCAGKQSESACKAAQKLNLERGLPVESCYY